MSGTVINSPSPPNHLFAYGTFMKDQPRHHLLERARVTSITPASVSGELVNLGEYPGLRLSAYAKTRVMGELIEFEALDTLIDELDQVEGPEFRRELVNVALPNGGNHFAWTYVLASNTGNLPVIQSGDWRKK